MAWISGNYYLNQSEMENNALEFTTIGYAKGWTKNAISAMLGNMQDESGINPGIWEMLISDPQTFYNIYGRYPGYGLTQWTPYTKYSIWATAEGYTWQDNGPVEMDRISYEAVNGLQWDRNNELGIDPPITLSQFLVSNLHIYDLSNYWLWFYEHPADPGVTTQTRRQNFTQYWYDFIPDPGPQPPQPGNIPPWLLFQFDKWRRIK